MFKWISCDCCFSNPPSPKRRGLEKKEKATMKPQPVVSYGAELHGLLCPYYSIRNISLSHFIKSNFIPSKQLHSQLSLHLQAILATHCSTHEVSIPARKSKQLITCIYMHPRNYPTKEKMA